MSTATNAGAVDIDSGMPADGPTAAPEDTPMTDVPPVPPIPPVEGVVGTTAPVVKKTEDLSMIQDSSRQYRSKVNGLGMWSAWERNFSNKLKACLDLVDNAVDAALWDSDDEEEEEEENEGMSLSERERWEKQSGGIHISTEKHRLAMGDYDSDNDEEKNEKDSNGEKVKDADDKDAVTKPPLFLVHDVFGPLGGRTKGTKNEDVTSGGGKNDFQLIDDENTLCLHNDCVNPVKELRKILDVYNSDKTDSAIGENGVGVKQAAAAMSDLSIVITTRIDEEPLLMDYGNFEGDGRSVKRIRKCLVSVGVLAKKMQSSDACMIPSWTIPLEFNIDEPNEKQAAEEEKKYKDGDNSNEIGKGDEDDLDDGDLVKYYSGDTCKPVLIRELTKITSSNRLLGKTMREFGGAAAKNRRHYGVQRLAKHIELMITSSSEKKSKSNNKKPKPPHPHQYLMILHKFGKHLLGSDKYTKNGGDKSAAVIKARNELDDLLRDLAEEMPRTYLHIPPAPFFKVKVNREVLKFQYWERHLVELHQIPLIIDRANDFRTSEDWLIPESEDTTYECKVSIGFDPTRANPQGGPNSSTNTFIGGQACSLLIFSRISGRLFLKHDDARGVLRLTNSGTNFCQGLTIIVDDFEGHLPLTPTKESLAFGQEDYGKNHERNLYAWLGALANVYWTHFHDIYKSKRALGNAIKAKMDHINQLERKEAVDLPTLRFGDFSTVEKLCFSRERVKDSIRPYKSDFTKWTLGPSTLIKFGRSNAPKAKKERDANSKKRKAVELAGLDGYDSDGNDLMEGAPPPSAFENNASDDIGKEPQQDNSEKVPVRERLDGRPRRATREPQRFEEIPETPKTRKKRGKFKEYKNQYKGEKGDDVRLKKKLRDTENELSETLLELNASKASCDDLQMQLEELEQAGIQESNKMSELKTELNESEAKHKAEIQKIKEDYEKQMEALRARLKDVKEETEL